MDNHDVKCFWCGPLRRVDKGRCVFKIWNMADNVKKRGHTDLDVNPRSPTSCKRKKYMEKDKKEQALECNNLCKGVQVPTEDEMVVLKAMRHVKGQTKVLKEKRAQLEPSKREADKHLLIEIEEELAGLKREWKHLEAKRKATARERMILLGHEERE